MADWFNVFASGHEFRPDGARALHEDGFVVNDFVNRGDGSAGTTFSARMRPETLGRLASLARYVLAV